jgi:NADPH:quinone reductase-like Zn-dependent oxidoreductase
VLDVGIEDFEIGDRVVSNGSHAEMVRVPKNLCAKIPDDYYDYERRSNSQGFLDSGY